MPLPRASRAVACAAAALALAAPATAQAATFRMTHPKGRTWRSGTASGDILASVLDRSPRKRSVLVLATFSARDVQTGDTAAGSVFALCR